jgi:hypothetical protein
MSRVFFTSALTGGREWLAWVAAAYDIRGNNVSPIDSFDISMIGNSRPMFG